MSTSCMKSVGDRTFCPSCGCDGESHMSFSVPDACGDERLCACTKPRFPCGGPIRAGLPASANRSPWMLPRLQLDSEGPASLLTPDQPKEGRVFAAVRRKETVGETSGCKRTRPRLRWDCRDVLSETRRRIMNSISKISPESTELDF